MAEIPKVKEIPLLFTDDMVAAVNKDIKTETRRNGGLLEINKNPNDWILDGIQINDGFIFHNKLDNSEFWIKSPYGSAGDVIWVRESWRPFFVVAIGNGSSTNAAARIIEFRDKKFKMVEFDDFEWFDKKTADGKYRWQPNMFLRRKYCRTFLRIESVHIERLHDITKEGALAEGIQAFTKDEVTFKYGLDGWEWQGMPRTAVEAYKRLWDSINGEDLWVDGVKQPSMAWEANPWVWVIRFKKIANYEAQ